MIFVMFTKDPNIL